MRRAWWVLLALSLSSTARAQDLVPRDEYRCQVIKDAGNYDPQYPPPSCELVPGVIPTTKEANPKLRAAGWMLVIIGAAWAIPYGDNFEFLGDDYCVSQYSVEAGRCGNPSWKWMASGAMIGTGFAFIKIGGRQVAIRPEIASQRRAVSATLRW